MYECVLELVETDKKLKCLDNYKYNRGKFNAENESKAHALINTLHELNNIEKI